MFFLTIVCLFVSFFLFAIVLFLSVLQIEGFDSTFLRIHPPNTVTTIAFVYAPLYLEIAFVRDLTMFYTVLIGPHRQQPVCIGVNGSPCWIRQRGNAKKIH